MSRVHQVITLSVRNRSLVKSPGDYEMDDINSFMRKGRERVLLQAPCLVQLPLKCLSLLI